MGLFSSRTKITVGTSVSRVIEDENLPGSSKVGLLKAIFQDEDLVPNLAEEVLSSIGVKAERMYKYAEQTYVNGLPGGSYHIATQGTAAVKTVLQTLEGKTIVIEYSRLGPPNTMHLGWMKLVASYGYDAVTNEIKTLSTLKGKPVYLKDMVVEIPPAMLAAMEPGTLDHWGIPAKAGYRPQLGMDVTALAGVFNHSPVVSNDTVTQEQVRIIYVWENPVQIGIDRNNQPYYRQELMTEELVIPITGHDVDKDYFHVKYLVNGLIKYWMYRVGQGTYPTLDELYAAPQEKNGTFFPFIHFRLNKQSTNSSRTTQEYITSKRALKYLGMDFDLIADGINANPGIADVEQATLMFAVPASTTNPAEQQYLFDFFSNWYADGTEEYDSERIANLYFMLQNNPDSGKNVIVIQDAKFKMALSARGIFKKRVAGSLGPIGTHESGVETSLVAMEYTEYDTDETVVQSMPVQFHYYRRQITEQFYDEIRVAGLRMLYFVHGEYTALADETDDFLLIPIDRSITQHHSIKDRELLYSRSLHYVFNSLVVTKVKWYETGTFKIIMLVASVVLTIVSMGATFEAFVAAAATMSTTAIVTAVAMGILKFLIVTVAVKLFVRAVGVEIALVIAAIAAVYGVVSSVNAGSVAGAPFAQDLMSLVTSLTDAIGDSIKQLMEDLIGESQEFNLLAEAKYKELEEVNNLLDGRNAMSPFIIFGESPTDFYNRTVHSGNIGVVGIEAISEFVNVALTLPKIDETLGGAPL